MGTHTLTAAWVDAVTIPSDSVTPRSASSVNVPIGGIGDNTKWLRDKLVQIQQVDIDNGEPPYGTTIATITGSTNYTAVTGTTLTFSDAAVGDVLVLAGTASVLLGNTSNADCVGKMRYHIWEDFSGTPVQVDGGFAMIWEGVVYSAQPRIRTLPLTFKRSVSKAGQLRVALNGAVDDAAENLVFLHVSYTATLYRYVSPG